MTLANRPNRVVIVNHKRVAVVQPAVAVRVAVRFRPFPALVSMAVVFVVGV